MFRAVLKRFGLAILAIAALVSGSFVLTGSASAAAGYAGYVYTEANPSGPNSVWVLGRGANGSLTPISTIWTGGKGTGSGLGSEGALALSDDGKWLVAVDAGSDDISVISVKDGLAVSRVASGGALPTSLTLSGKLVYVLNHDSDSITGFSLDNAGKLHPIPNSTQPLSGTGVDAKQVQFSPDGQVLVVTEKNTNLIDTYKVKENGVATGHTIHPSSGHAPFGFDFGDKNTLVVSEAANSAASSYRVSDDGSVTLVSGSVTNGQVAACWVVVTNNSRYAYTADAHNGMISGYAIAHDGSLTLLNANGITGTTGGAPLDEAISRNDKFLYVLNPSIALINAFRVNSDGSLVSLTGASGIPASAAGLIAR
jgi:6-phosphogluconolactonase